MDFSLLGKTFTAALIPRQTPDSNNTSWHFLDVILPHVILHETDASTFSAITFNRKKTKGRLD
jgi:hypothetical protein